MSITDQQILSEIQQAMAEPVVDGGVTWTSTMWSATEVLNYLNQRQDRFLKESLILISWTTLSVNAAQQAVSMPVDWISTERISWQGTGGSTFVRLPKSDSWEADNAIPTWRTVTATRPQLAFDSALQTLILLLAPAPTGAGTLSFYYCSIGDPLTGLGNVFTVPDEFVPYIKWGVLADMLNKPGTRVGDADRAQYCEMRFEEGVTLAKSWLSSKNF